MLHYSPIDIHYASALGAVHRACFSAPWSSDSFAQLLALPTTQGVACDAGFILCCVVGDEAEILTICVLPTHRRQGIASHLLAQMEEKLRQGGVVSFFLDVNAHNIAAVSLYHQCGFQEVGRRTGYYQTATGRQDALILKKELK